MKKQITTAVLLAGCVGGRSGGAVARAITSDTDYSNSGNWLALPPSPDKAVDVFYVYPTEYVAGPNGPVISTIHDPGMVAGAQEALGEQASAFAAIGHSTTTSAITTMAAPLFWPVIPRGRR